MMPLYDTSERNLFTHEHHTDHSVQRQEQLEDMPVCENANVMSAESRPAQRARPTISPYGNTCPPSLQTNTKSQPTVERKSAYKSLNFAEVEFEYMGGDLTIDIDDESLAIHPELMDTEPSTATSDGAQMTNKSPFVQTMENVPLGDKTSPVDIDLVKKEPKDAEPSLLTGDTPRVLFESVTSSDKEEDRGQMPQENSVTETPSFPQPGKKHSGSHSKQLKRRPKTNYTKSEKDLFNKIYNKCQHLKQVEKKYLAEHVGKHQDQIGGWFTNKRNREKDKQCHRRPDHSFLHDTKLRPEFLACFADISIGASTSTIKENHLPMESSANEAQSETQIIASCMSKILDNVESAVPCHSILTEKQTQNEGTYIDMDDKPLVIHPELMDSLPSTATNDGAQMTNQSPFAQTMENVPLGDKTLPVNLDLVKKEIMDAEPSLVTDDTPRVLFESVTSSGKEEDKSQMPQKQEKVTETASPDQADKKHSGSPSKKLKRRPKTNYTKLEKDLFNKIYNKCPYLKQVEKKSLAKVVRKHQDQIGGWFTNKRNREKDKKRYIRPDHAFFSDTKLRPEFLACFEDIFTGASTSTIKENHLLMESSANEAQSETLIIASCMSKILDNVESAVPCHSISTEQQTGNEETSPVNLDFVKKELLRSEPSMVTDDAPTVQHEPVNDELVSVASSMNTDDDPLKNESTQNERAILQPEILEKDSVGDITMCSPPKCHKKWLMKISSNPKRKRSVSTDSKSDDFIGMSQLSDEKTDEILSETRKPMHCDTLPQNPTKRRRKNFSEEEKAFLNRIYNNFHYLKPAETKHLAELMRVDHDKIKSWFQTKRRLSKGTITTPPNRKFYKDTEIRTEYLSLLVEIVEWVENLLSSPANELTISVENHHESEVQTISLLSSEGSENQQSEMPTEISPSFDGAANYQEGGAQTESSPSFDVAANYQEDGAKTESSPSFDGAANYQEDRVQTESSSSFDGVANYQEGGAEAESSPSFDGTANYQEGGAQTESSPSFDSAANYQEDGAKTESSPSFDGAANYQEDCAQTESSPNFDSAANCQEDGAQTESSPSFDGAANYQEDYAQTESSPNFDGAANYQEDGVQAKSSPSFDNA